MTSREEVIAAIEAEGWTVEFVEWCEDAETPGLLGMKAGCTIPSRRAVKIKTRDASEEQIVAVLEHELEHVLGADWATDRPDLCLQCGGWVDGFGNPVERRDRG